MTTNAQKIQDWRDAHPRKTLTEELLLGILETTMLQGTNLFGANLRGADLRGVDLSWTDMFEVDLRGADLREANLFGAALPEANLSDADLDCANLRWADLYAASLQEARLCGADVQGADLQRANLRGADLTWANLTGINLAMVDLLDVDLCGGISLDGGYFIPTPAGWRITIGPWKHKTLDEFRALIDDQAARPGAESAERERCRPILAGLLDMCEAHAAAHPGIVYELAKIHGTGGKK